MPGLVLERKSVREVIKKILSERYPKLDITLFANVLEAIVQTESDFTTTAFRFEPGFYSKYGKLHPIGASASYGLMQIMGLTARENGFKKDFTELFNMEVGLENGIKFFMSLYTKYKNLDDAIASYNAGSPRKKEDGTYVNQIYVDKVKKHMKIAESIA